MNWYLEVLKKYTVFGGRARRTEYWMFTLFNIIISVAIGFVIGLIGLPAILGHLYTLAVLLPAIGVSIRRLHDTNRSGWWLLLGFIPIIGAIVLIVFFATEGQKEENQYGPDPKGAAA